MVSRKFDALQLRFLDALHVENFDGISRISCLNQLPAQDHMAGWEVVSPN